jgi:tetratricopeptide (TPR) repeat protein
MKNWIVLSFMFCCFVANGQTNVLLEEAKAFDRQYNTPQAILKYDEALKSNPNQIAILVRMVEIYCSGLEEIKEEESKKVQLNKAKEYLLLAKTIDSTHADYLYLKAVYLGKLIETSPIKEKAQYTKEIKSLLDDALTQDSNHVKSLYTLAKWNEEVSGLNPAVKAAMKVIFGGLPPASRDQALELHQKARKLNPGFLANNYDLALLLKKTNKPSQAIEVLQAQMKLPTKTKEELEFKNLSKQLLQNLQ